MGPPNVAEMSPLSGLENRQHCLVSSRLSLSFLFLLLARDLSMPCPRPLFSLPSDLFFLRFVK